MWNWTKHPAPDDGNESSVSDKTPRILLLSPDRRYRDHWRRLSGELAWGLECASTLDRALDVQSVRPFPIVIYDCCLDIEQWQEALEKFCVGNDMPCVVLTSEVIDDGLRNEVIRHRGYDILRRNADDDEVIRAVNAAWMWKHCHV